jgi:hypothetical protein
MSGYGEEAVYNVVSTVAVKEVSSYFLRQPLSPPKATLPTHTLLHEFCHPKTSSKHQHTALGYQIQTATPIHYKKIRGAKAAAWARDQSHIMSTMPTPTAYDQSTPPSPAHNKPLPPTPRQSFNDAPTSLFAVRPHAVSPRPGAAPREHGLQDDLYYAFTREAYISSSTPAAQDVVKRLNLYCPRPISQTQYQQHQRILPRPNFPSSRRPRTELERLSTRAPSSKMATQISNRQLPSLPPKPLAPIAKATTWANSTWTFEKTGRKKRRPSEIFNVNFGFGFPSRKKTSSDHTPNISPRTSLYSASGSPPQEALDSFKRQRIDSTDLDVAMVFGLDKAALAMNVAADDRTPTEPLTPPTSTHCGSTGEAHPGHLIDFTTPSYTAPALLLPALSPHPTSPIEQTSASSTFNLRLSTNAYHNYLATTHRRKSFPAGEWAARHVREEFAMLHRLEKLDSEAKGFVPFSPSHTTSNPSNKKRACASERQDAAKRRSPSPTTSPTVSKERDRKEGKTAGDCVLKRSSSDPSTAAFLTHIRASLSAREKSKPVHHWQTYPVFADEAEKGFLSDAPL